MSFVQHFAHQFAQRLIREQQQEAAMIDSALKEMTDSDRYVFNRKYKTQKKSLQTAYLCLVGGFGAHYLYLGKTKTQLLFWVTLGGCGVWYFICAITMFFIVDDYNRDLAFSIISDIWNYSIDTDTGEHAAVAAQAVAGDGLTFVAPETPTPIRQMTVLNTHV